MFNSLLVSIQKKTKRPGVIPDALKDIVFINNAGGELEIRYGGFPIFNNQTNSIYPEKIWPIHASLLLACLMCTNLHYQQHHFLETSTNILKLDPIGQLEILREYQQLNPNDPYLKHITYLTDEKLLEYVTIHSKTKDCENPFSLNCPTV